MVIQTDLCPGVGYVGYPQQQGYAMHQQSQYLTNVYYRPVSGTQMVPIPYTTGLQYPDHHEMVYGGHNQKREGWKETNRHQDGWYGGSGHCGVGYNSKDQKHEGWKEMSKHQDGWYGGSGHHGLGYESNDPSKFSPIVEVPSKHATACVADCDVPSKYASPCTAKCEVPSNGYGAHTNGPPATWGSGQPYPRHGSQTVEYWAVKGG